MRLGLGIDTGSTYTDCVAIDFDTKKIIARAKAPTTHYDLSIGLINSMNKVLTDFSIDPKDVKLLSLSTTLATNAIVESKGGEVALIVIGYTPYEEWKFPAKLVYYTEGGESAIRSEEIPPDFDAITEWVKKVATDVDSFAVSGFMSVISNSYEKMTADIIRKHTNLPVVCGSDLSSKLGLYERSVTAVLNARLIPLTDDLLKEVKVAMGEKGIDAPLMVVRGDGSLISELVARERPIETLQSGPAASSMGGCFLAGKKSAIIVDIGGTTTDIAVLENGFPKVTEEGSLVGGWRTRVRSVDTVSEGLGCESNITVTDGTDIHIGPRRVIPLATAAKEYPSILEKIRNTGNLSYLTTYQASRKTVKAETEVHQLLDAINKLNPVAEDELKAGLDEFTKMRFEESLAKLEELDAVMRIGFTPLDILHVQKRYIVGDAEASQLGAQMLGDQMGKTPEEFCQEARAVLVKKAGAAVLKKLITEWSKSENLCGTCHLLMDKSMDKDQRYFNCTMEPVFPIVGVGGPAEEFLPALKEILNTEVIIPECYEVGNAVGAVSGRVSWTVEKRIIRKEIQNRYYVYPDGAAILKKDDAIKYAIEHATKEARTQAIRAGAQDPKIVVEKEDFVVMLVTGRKDYGGSNIKVSAVGEALPKV